MPSTTQKNDARLNFRLTRDHKELIEQAASELGQSVSEFAVSILLRSAREVIQESYQTRLSNRDRDKFLAVLDQVDGRPNQALKAAARKYKARLG